MKDAGVKIEKVEPSKHLTDSPVVVVTSQFSYSAQQEKIRKAQAFQNKAQTGMMAGRKTLEVNVHHPVMWTSWLRLRMTRRTQPYWTPPKFSSRQHCSNLATNADP